MIVDNQTELYRLDIEDERIHVYRLGPEQLAFDSNNDEITIDNNTASWNLQEETSLNNVTFTAYCPEGNSETSNPITLEAEEPPSELQLFLNSV